MVIRIGLVGTGYAAQKRVQALHGSSRAKLVAVWGQDRDRAQALVQANPSPEIDPLGGDEPVVIESSWLALTQRSDIDLVMVATRNHLHGAIAQAALQANKHVVVEYPLALDLAEAEALVELARSQQRLLHIEHIELLSGIHHTIQTALPQIGRPYYCRVTSFKGEQTAPQRWSYHALEFGFPLMAALSRIQRLVNLFGPVDTVSCTCQYWQPSGTVFTPSPAQPFYAAVLCTAQLVFNSGLLAEVVYGKGQGFWSKERCFDVQGSAGRLQVEPGAGQLLRADGQQTLTVGSRRGLFAQDTAQVLAALENNVPLYITPTQSLYALRVADAARRSARDGVTVTV